MDRYYFYSKVDYTYKKEPRDCILLFEFKKPYCIFISLVDYFVEKNIVKDVYNSFITPHAYLISEVITSNNLEVLHNKEYYNKFIKVNIDITELEGYYYGNYYDGDTDYGINEVHFFIPSNVFNVCKSNVYLCLSCLEISNAFDVLSLNIYEEKPISNCNIYFDKKINDIFNDLYIYVDIVKIKQCDTFKDLVHLMIYEYIERFKEDKELYREYSCTPEEVSNYINTLKLIAKGIDF